MKKDILLIHGAGGDAYDWTIPFLFPLKDLQDNYNLHIPRMPDADNPSYEKWKKVIEKELANLGEDPILIGHSLGASVLLKYFSENPGSTSYDSLFLVATPFWGEPDWEYPEFELKADFAQQLTQFKKIYLLQNTDDPDVPFAHRDIYAKHITNAIVLPSKNSGHLSEETIKQVAEEIESQRLSVRD